MAEGVGGRKKRHRDDREGFSIRALGRRLGVAGFVAALAVALVAVASPTPALAADMTVSVTQTSPTTPTVNSGVAVTYTLTYSCSNAAGSCADSVATIPTTTVTGNGTNTDFSSWVKTGTCPAVNKSVAGRVSFSLGTLSTGTATCTFTVTPPDFQTLNNASASIAATLSSTNSASATSAPVTLTAAAAHNITQSIQIPGQVIQGNPFNYTMVFNCAANTTAPQGDLGTSTIELAATLPAGFDYQTYSLSSSNLPGTVVYDPATRVIRYSDPTGASCGVTSRIVFVVTGNAATNGVPDAVGSKVCITSTSTWTYLDGVPGSATNPSQCSTVIAAATVVGKNVATSTLGNLGQYKFTDGSTPPYTYPGDWDGTGQSTYFDILAGSVGGPTNGGVMFDIKDPMPCLTNLSGGVYSSNAVGTYCTAPAYIPTLLTPFNFPVTAADAITLVYTDGSTGTVPYTTGKGWVIPTTPAVAQVNIPAFAGEGSNSAANITLRLFGYASPSAQTPSEIKNTVSSTPYAVGSSTPLVATQTASRVELVTARPAGNGALVFPALNTTQVGTTCAANVTLTGTNTYSGSRIEIPTAPSQAIYIDYLAPVGATAVNAPTTTFTLNALNPLSQGVRPSTTPAIAPTLTQDHNGTGRTLVRYVIPAGTATLGGLYRITSASFVSLTLEAGCAGTYQSDVTIGYGAPITQCYLNNARTASISAAPLNPWSSTDLRANGAPTAGNYCGESAPLKIAPIRAGFTVDKTVQGNLDPSPVGIGNPGHVSNAGGAATYTVSFKNSGEATLDNPVMYDLLPRVGDTLASQTTARGSQFPVTLTGVGTLPSGLSVAYSQAVNPCRPEVLATNPGCVDDWSATAPSPLSKTTALKFSYAGRVTVGTVFAATYTVSTPVVVAGQVAKNTVGTNATAGDALVGTGAESSVTDLQAQSAQPAVTKTADRTTVDAVGQAITYTFTVTNNTAVTLANVRVADALTDAAPSSIAPAATCSALSSPAATCSGAVTTLVPGQSATFTARYVTTQADLDHGRISDQATATADPPSGPGLSNSSGVVTVTATQNGALGLTKSATPDTVDSVGDVVTYTFTATNTGNLTLKTLGITEKSFSGSGALSSITCPPDALAPGASIDCTASYPITQADLTAGSVVNTAAASAKTPAGVTVASADSTATVTVNQVAGLAIVKSATPSSSAAYNAGQLITYSYVVSNTGNIPVTGIAVNEKTFTGTGIPSAISCPATALDPAAQFTCTSTYTLTQADVDSGSLSNTANATGNASTGPVTAEDSTATTPQEAVSKLTLTKTAGTAYVNATGETITYTFAIRNTGNVTVHDVAASETAFSGTGGTPVTTCPTTTLVPGQEVDCTATYTVTQADMNSGSIVNTAEATGVDPNDAGVTSAKSTATVTVNAAPGISVEKTADLASFTAVGTAITFSFAVTNIGNVALSDVAVTEGDFTGSAALGAIDCPTGDIAPGDVVTCSAGYETTQADLDRGSIVNTATASGRTATGAGVVSDPSTVTVAAVQTPALTLEKTVDPGSAASAGDAVTYTFHVTNTGNVTLTALAVAETGFSGTGGIAVPGCGSAPLAPGADRSCELTYRVTQADVDAGTVTNTAVATATAGVATVTSDPSTATVSIERKPALSLVKSASPSAPADFVAGQQITYTFVITNTGNVTVTDPAVQEGHFTGTGTLDAPVCASADPLAPGAQLICSTVYTVTQADIDAASVTNTAAATGVGPAGTDPLAPPSSSVTVPEPSKPSLALLKTSDTKQLAAAGQVVTYSFTVTNTGNTTATKVGVKEGAFSGRGTAPVLDCSLGTLLPGQTATCSAPYTVVAADLDGKPLTNTATAFSGTPSGSDVSSDPSTATIDDVVTAAGPGDPAGQGDPADPTGLARTGSTIAWGVGILALGALAVGTLLMLRRRPLN
ncbi:hypothetical protein P5G50_00160 [Leifsonia sp. F6_8S_P_1B]|uniref:DUF7507 domain-containing protein n=1 Tax=Leifsonia williamsii TaxID=3035919 RepID=A0ABT8K5W9_9MICO|nr:hypothetical protein [Leifsonia williamsii]MDN4612846.1 hypothetical protein [Leifsonia williamsii]